MCDETCVVKTVFLLCKHDQAIPLLKNTVWGLVLQEGLLILCCCCSFKAVITIPFTFYCNLLLQVANVEVFPFCALTLLVRATGRASGL